jgi:hypothetical protein
MTIEGGTAIVLAYLLVSTGVIIAFWLAVLVIGWFIGRLRQHRRQQRGGNRTGSRGEQPDRRESNKLIEWFNCVDRSEQPLSPQVWR